MTIEINGNTYEPRSLTIGEVRKLRAIPSEGASDATGVAWACGILAPEVEAWFETVPAGTALAAIAEVMAVSGLSSAATFPGSAERNVGSERPAQ